MRAIFTGMLLLLVAAALCMVLLAGERRRMPRRVVHGWPLLFLERAGPEDGGQSAWISLWSFRDGVEQFDRRALAIDIAVACGIFAVAAAVLLWRHRRGRPPWQLSLADGLAALVAIAGVLAYWGSAFREASRQWQVVDEIVQITHDEAYWFYFPHRQDVYSSLSKMNRVTWQTRGHWFLEWFYPPDEVPLWFAEVVEFHCYLDSMPGDAVAEWAAQLPELRALTIWKSTISPPRYAQLARLQRLEYLDLSDVGMNDEALAHIARLDRLERLDIGYNEITDKGLAHLSRLSRLRQLDLTNTQVTDDGVDRLRSHLPELAVWDD